jgi:hypothetical protein
VKAVEEIKEETTERTLLYSERGKKKPTNSKLF